jgi:2-C-methyl-D-erythritol 2,4-cyclodiphosphate synthase
MHRVGLGTDSHPLIEDANGKVILGGVVVAVGKRVVADSEGDVVIHALCNALSTAIGGGSLDTWARPMTKQGIFDSKQFLQEIMSRLKDQHYKIENIAIMIEALWPRLEHHREAMTDCLAGALEIEVGQIGIACTSGEGLTAFGRGEGIYVLAEVLLEKSND